MRWLLLILLIPLVHGACFKVSNTTVCEDYVTINLIDNETFELDDDVFISKQKYLGNFVLILVALSVIIITIISLVKT